jgi:predicted lipid-binding transport protein (Tim44 family)
MALRGSTLSPVKRTSVVQGARTDVMMELSSLADGAGHFGTAAKAEAYRAAAETIAEGAAEVTVGRRTFKVIQQPHWARIDRVDVLEGTRAEVLADLEQYRADRAGDPQFGRIDKSAEYVRAIEEIQGGASSVRVRATIWRVTEG